MTVPRTQIRNYIAARLKLDIPVGNRVFTNRRSTLFQEELPAICIEYGIDNKNVLDGDKYHAKTYENTVQLSIIVAVEEVQEVDVDTQQSTNGQDLVDLLGNKVERSLGNDWRLAKLLDGYDPNENYFGLVNGLRIVGGDMHEVDTDSGRKLLAQEIGVVLFYENQAFDNLRLPDFSQYYFGFTGFEDSEIEGTIPSVATAGHIDLQFDQTTQNGTLIGIIPGGRYASFALVQMQNASNPGSFASVGDSADIDRLMKTDDIFLNYVNQYMTLPQHFYSSDTEVNLYLTGSPMTQGSGRVVVHYG